MVSIPEFNMRTIPHVTRVYAEERIAYQSLSLFYDILPAKCHAEENVNQEGNHRASVKHRNFFPFSVPATFYLSDGHL